MAVLQSSDAHLNHINQEESESYKQQGSQLRGQQRNLLKMLDSPIQNKLTYVKLLPVETSTALVCDEKNDNVNN